MKYVFGIAVALAAIMAAWEIGEPEITNLVFQDELRDTASQLGMRIGYADPNSDKEICNAVIRKATRHDISLDPDQVTVRRSGTPENPVIFIAVDYTVPVDLLVYSFTLHFHPTSDGGKL